MLILILRFLLTFLFYKGKLRIKNKFWRPSIVISYQKVSIKNLKTPLSKPYTNLQNKVNDKKEMCQLKKETYTLKKIQFYFYNSLSCDIL